MSPEELLAVADGVIDRTESGEQLEAVATWQSETEVRAYDGEVEHFVAADTAALGIRVVRDGRQGVSWTPLIPGRVDEAAIAECLAEARDNARFGTPDEHAGLAEPDGAPVATLRLFDERLAATSTEEKIRLAVELERLVRAGDPRMVGVESADYADSVTAGAIVTSTGIRSAGAETSTFLGAWSLASDGDDTTTGFGFSVGRAVEDLDPETAAAEAVERAVRMLGATKPRSERLTVVLHPYVTSQFVSLVTEMLSGESVSRGRSPFADRVGEVVAVPGFTLLDDAVDPLAPTASDLDGEGLACRQVPLVADGVLQGFLHNAYTARSMGTTSTGSAQRGSHRSVPGVGPRAAKVLPGALTPEQVLAQVGDGLLVHEVSGLHSGVNPVSGDLSVGVEGVMVSGGEEAGAVREATINSTLQRMLTDVVAIGADLTYFPWESCGVTLAVADVTLSGS
jgi:PmbA protein